MVIRSPLAGLLALLASACAGASAQDPTSGQETAEPSAATAAPADPMAGFARLVSGEWRRPALTGLDMFETWHWGPGRHSMLSQTYGTDAEGRPWRSLQAYYWHPGHDQIRLLGLDPFARGVSEGTIRFEGETAHAVFDLHQTGGLRNMSFRWAFDGPDRYHATLLEDSGRGFTPLVEWDYVRFEALSSMPPSDAAEARTPSQRLSALEPLLGEPWTSRGHRGDGEALHVETEVEWIPHAEAIHVRLRAPTVDGEPPHLLEAFLYHHTGTGALRCLALSHRGGVYEGDLTVLEDGALELDLVGHEGDRAARYLARLDRETEDALRSRIWSLEGLERTLLLDLRHERPEPEQD